TTGDLTIATPTTGQNIPATYTINFSGPAGSGSEPIASNTTTTFSAIPSGDYTLQLDAGATCTVAAPNPRTVTVPPNGATSTTFSVSCMCPVRRPCLPPAYRPVQRRVRRGRVDAPLGQAILSLELGPLRIQHLKKSRDPPTA